MGNGRKSEETGKFSFRFTEEILEVIEKPNKQRLIPGRKPKIFIEKEISLKNFYRLLVGETKQSNLKSHETLGKEKVFCAKEKKTLKSTNERQIHEKTELLLLL